MPLFGAHANQSASQAEACHSTLNVERETPGSLLTVYSRFRSWIEAERACADEGLQLATPRTKEDIKVGPWECEASKSHISPTKQSPRLSALEKSFA